MTSPSASPPPTHPTPKPFRFKSKDPRPRSRSPTSTSHHPSRSHRHHRHHHRRRSNPPSPQDPLNSLDPDTAFRESLFDALADDEGAAFWEGVYGQPIHTYSPYYKLGGTSGKANLSAEDLEQESLRRMTDEEYAAFVRQKMWEKSHEYIVLERRKREEDRARRKAKEEEGRKWEQSVKEALKRGEERRRGSRWKKIWERYAESWERTTAQGGSEKASDIVWPVESGLRRDISKEEVERFFRRAPRSRGGREEEPLGTVLKAERVRWHPDKMQQRAGSEGLEGETVKAVTAVWQIIDQLWAEVRKK
ncbi:MAG: hypothetical protein LQ342_007380 [Letrouitia transgressa]|nr:MAG: hypothetical protein LQ342_007380 [Letrouitia transgressa]